MESSTSAVSVSAWRMRSAPKIGTRDRTASTRRRSRPSAGGQPPSRWRSAAPSVGCRRSARPDEQVARVQAQFRNPRPRGVVGLAAAWCSSNVSPPWAGSGIAVRDVGIAVARRPGEPLDRERELALPCSSPASARSDGRAAPRGRRRPGGATAARRPLRRSGKYRRRGRCGGGCRSPCARVPRPATVVLVVDVVAVEWAARVEHRQAVAGVDGVHRRPPRSCTGHRVRSPRRPGRTPLEPGGECRRGRPRRSSSSRRANESLPRRGS